MLTALSEPCTTVYYYFLLRIVRFQLFAPEFVESQKGKTAKKNFYQLQVVLKKAAKHWADVEFIQTCATYLLHPKFLRFKQHKMDCISITE